MEINKEKLERVVETAKAKTDNKRWRAAIDKAFDGLTGDVWIVTELANSLLITTESGETYNANGVCQCEAYKFGTPCKHRAAARLVAMMREEEASASSVRTGYLGLDGWAGVRRHKVEIVGETPTRYRIKAIEKMKLAGRNRWLSPGATTLVPKHAVEMEEAPSLRETAPMIRPEPAEVRYGGWMI